MLDRIKHSLIRHYQHFLEELAKISEKIEIDVKSINRRYKQLTQSGHRHNINYNYYVDEIIRVSPPYKLTLKASKIKPEPKKREYINKINEKNEYYLESLGSLEYETGSLSTYDSFMPLHEYENYLINRGDDPINLASPYCCSDISEEYIFQEGEDILKLIDYN